MTSAPVLDELALALDESDNALTESLTRQAAYLEGDRARVRAGRRLRPRHRGRPRGRPLGVATVDASGLSRQNQLPARVLGDVMALGAGGSSPEWPTRYATCPSPG